MQACYNVICLLLVAAIGLPCVAQPSSQGAWTPVGDQTLANLRGGFDAGNGLVISFGIERMVSINGSVVASNSFRFGAVDSSPSAYAMTALNLIQNGAGNTYRAGPMPVAAAGSVIQNSLNDQVLSSLTLINSSVNSGELLKTIHFQTSLRDALNNAAGIK